MRSENLAQNLGTNHQELFSLLNELPAFVYLMAPDYSIRFANRTFLEMFGDPDNKHCYELIKRKPCPCDECPSLDTLAKKRSLHWEQTSLNGRVYDIYERFFADENNSPYVLKIGVDITERKKAECEIARFERLHNLAEMAAGIAHEVRNPLTTVRGFLQILEKKNSNPQFQAYYEIMISELDRATSIITEFLSLARTQTTVVKKQNLNDIINALSPLIKADALNLGIIVKENLDYIKDLDLNEREIRQVILNLVRNGLEAMGSGGTLEIRTFMDNGQVVLAIKDQGKGIDPILLDKLGTPFFTTKERGTGLGLAICYSIVNRHNAKIDIDTSPQGTTFYIRFNTI